MRIFLSAAIVLVGLILWHAPPALATEQKTPWQVLQERRGQSEAAAPNAGAMEEENGGLLGALFLGMPFQGLTMADFALLGVLLGVGVYLLRRSSGPRDYPQRPDLNQPQNPHDDVPGPGRDSESFRRGEQMWQHLSSKPRAEQDAPPPIPGTPQPGAGSPGKSAVSAAQAGFDVNDLLHGAKLVYPRVHESLALEDWDDLAPFVTTEFLDRLRHQARPKADTPPQVLYLEAELLEGATRGGRCRALVAYKSLMQRPGAQASEDVHETWEFSKDDTAKATWRINNMRT